MTTLTNTTIDETQVNQVVYSSDLNAFLNITIMKQSDIDNIINQANAQITQAQATINTFQAFIATQTSAVQQNPSIATNAPATLG